MSKQTEFEEDEDTPDKRSSSCAQCRRELALGEDILVVQFSVLGARGPVPLDEPLLFCDESCVKRYFSDEPVQKMPRRIP